MELFFVRSPNPVFLAGVVSHMYDHPLLGIDHNILLDVFGKTYLES